MLKPMEYVQSYTHREIHSPEFFLNEQKAEHTFPNWSWNTKRHLWEQNSGGDQRRLVQTLVELPSRRRSWPQGPALGSLTTLGSTAVLTSQPCCIYIELFAVNMVSFFKRRTKSKKQCHLKCFGHPNKIFGPSGYFCR